MSEGHGWTGDLLDVLTQWGEYCDAASAGRAASRRRSDHGEHLVLFPVWQPESYALAFVDPVTEHVSFLGEGALPKLLELEKMARHAYGAGVGETLFPPLSVRLDGKDTRLRWAAAGASSPSQRVGPRHRPGAIQSSCSPCSGPVTTWSRCGAIARS